MPYGVAEKIDDEYAFYLAHSYVKAVDDQQPEVAAAYKIALNTYFETVLKFPQNNKDIAATTKYFLEKAKESKVRTDAQIKRQIERSKARMEDG